MLHLPETEKKREGFAPIPRTLAGVGHLKGICKQVFRMADAIQATHESNMVGSPGADFLRLVTFWSIRSSGAIRRFCVTGAALRMTWPHLFVAGAVLQTDGLEKSQKKNWHEAVSSALDSPFFEGGFAELPRF